MKSSDQLQKVEATLGELLSGERPAALCEAMRHAVFPGGKRLRPQICLAAARAVGGGEEDAIFPACAIELLHSYTLVHDDLPAMDDDAVRRGMPSVWAKFGEATAILAGDALQALAFRIAARAPRNVERILAALGEAGVGVVRGQSEELSAAADGQMPDIGFIHRHKTADLFIAAAKMGAYAGGGTDSDIAHLEEYALNFGLAFQLADDLADGDSPYPEDETRRRILELASVAVEALKGLPGDALLLASLAKRLGNYGPAAGGL